MREPEFHLALGRGIWYNYIVSEDCPENIWWRSSGKERILCYLIVKKELQHNRHIAICCGVGYGGRLGAISWRIWKSFIYNDRKGENINNE